MNEGMHYLVTILQKVGQSLWVLLPYIVAGIIIGEILKLTSWTKILYRVISKSPILSIFFSAVLGMASPLCTYGTVPVMLQLFKSGISLAPLVTFLSASAMMNPQLFFYTWGGLGLEMALVRIGAVMIFSLLLGIAIHKMPPEWIAHKHSLDERTNGNEILSRPKKIFQLKPFLKGIYETAEYVGFYMLIGLILGAVLEVSVTAQQIQTIFKPGKMFSIIIAVVMGVPLYVCGGGAITFIKGFLEHGMSKGAALAFLFVGPATRVNAIMALAAIIRARSIAVYLVILSIFAVGLGMIYH
jgi:uncharacterized protein